jgi:hypothetical protein
MPHYNNHLAYLGHQHILWEAFVTVDSRCRQFNNLVSERRRLAGSSAILCTLQKPSFDSSALGLFTNASFFHFDNSGHGKASRFQTFFRHVFNTVDYFAKHCPFKERPSLLLLFESSLMLRSFFSFDARNTLRQTHHDFNFTLPLLGIVDRS